MATFKELFHDGIKYGDWEKIKLAYKTITKEEPPKQELEVVTLEEKQAYFSIDSILDMEVEEIGHDKDILVIPKVTQEEKTLKDANELENVFVKQPKKRGRPKGSRKKKATVENTQLENTQLKNPLVESSLEENKLEEDFKIEQNLNLGGGKDGDGKKCKRMKMEIPEKRENEWIDDFSEHTDEDVRKNPSLGKQINSSGKRSELKKIAVKCFICGKKEHAFPTNALGYKKNDDENSYRCENCLPKRK